MLLDNPAAARPSKRSSSATAASAAPGEPDESTLDAERYRDLDPSRESELAEHGWLRWLGPVRRSPSPSPPCSAGLEPQQQQQQQQQHAAIPFDYGSGMNMQNQMLLGASSAMGTGSYHAVGFSYGNQMLGESLVPVELDLQPAAQAPAAALPAPGPDEPPFAPCFAIPEQLVGTVLPATERHYRVLEQTAGFVRQGGGQLEVLLRVKQAGSPLFAFLVPSDPLHAFYRWLVDMPPEARLSVDAAPGAAAAELAEAKAVRGAAEPAAAQGLQQPDTEQQQREQRQQMEIDSLALLQEYNDDWEEAAAEAADNAAVAEQQAEQQKHEHEHVATVSSLPREMAAAAQTSEPMPAAEAATEEEEEAETEPSPDQLAIMQKLIAFVQVRMHCCCCTHCLTTSFPGCTILL